MEQARMVRFHHTPDWILATRICYIHFFLQQNMQLQMQMQMNQQRQMNSHAQMPPNAAQFANQKEMDDIRRAAYLHQMQMMMNQKLNSNSGNGPQQPLNTGK